MKKFSLSTILVAGLSTVLCVFAFAWTVEATAAAKFWFWKDWSIKATQDVTIWWMKNNGNGTIKRNDALLDVIKWWVNWVLWIMALVALIFAIYWGIQMATARWEEWQYWDGIKIVQRALIGLLIIWVSWFIISAIFWLMRMSGEVALWGAGTDQ